MWKRFTQWLCGLELPWGLKTGHHYILEARTPRRLDRRCTRCLRLDLGWTIGPHGSASTSEQARAEDLQRERLQAIVQATATAGASRNTHSL